MTTSVLIVHWDDLLGPRSGIDLSPTIAVHAARKEISTVIADVLAARMRFDVLHRDPLIAPYVEQIQRPAMAIRRPSHVRSTRHPRRCSTPLRWKDST